jgi:hypothetical protein
MMEMEARKPVPVELLFTRKRFVLRNPEVSKEGSGVGV